MSLFKTKDQIKPKRFKTVYRSGKKSQKLKVEKQSEDNIIKNIINIFKLKKRKYNTKRQNDQRYQYSFGTARRILLQTSTSW